LRDLGESQPSSPDSAVVHSTTLPAFPGLSVPRGQENHACVEIELTVESSSFPERRAVGQTRHNITPMFTDALVERQEPVSPELVLVSSELRVMAIASLMEADDKLMGLAGRSPAPIPISASSDEPRRVRRALSMAARLLAYAAWQSFLGACFGFAVFSAFAVLVVALALVAR
jgi:hypothetical protein